MPAETLADRAPKTLSPTKTKAQALRSYDVADFPALNGLEEEWRFTPLKRLRGLATGTPDADHGPALRARRTAGRRHRVHSGQR